MKKAKTRLQAAADFLKTTGPSMMILPPAEGEVGESKVFMLGGGKMIWLAEKAGTEDYEDPVVTIDDLLASEETSWVVMDLFCVDPDEDFNAEKLYAFEDELRAVLKSYVTLPKERIREIKIMFMDAKEELLSED